MRKICVVTGSRAEYGLLSGLMKRIQQDESLQLQIIATNMHLSPEFGNTFHEIEDDGFTIDKKVEMDISSDSAYGIVKSMGEELSGMAEALDELKPDLLVVLGDRYEILMAVSAALIYKIPVAHLFGGEITEGAYDDAIRHAITKMSHLHFTSTEAYRKRIIQMGENPESVWYVGAIGVDNIKNEILLSKEALESNLNFKFSKKILLITYHSVTIENNSAEEQCRNLLSVLAEYTGYSFIFTQSNSDSDGRIITKLIQEFVNQNKERALFVSSLGKKRYLSLLKYTTAVVGNSSSGIIEVPSFGIPSVNIGNRQKGRIKCDSIIDCEPTYYGIRNAMNTALSDHFIQLSKSVRNPYEKAGTVDEIYRVIKTISVENLCSKTFYDL